MTFYVVPTERPDHLRPFALREASMSEEDARRTRKERIALGVHGRKAPEPLCMTGFASKERLARRESPRATAVRRAVIAALLVTPR